MTLNTTMTTVLEHVVGNLKLAAETGHYNGLIHTPSEAAYMRRCNAVAPIGLGRQVSLTFTRDVGHHTSGWFKNPEYERCRHLSMCFAEDSYWAPFDHRTGADIARRFFGDDIRWVWVEPPYTGEGRAKGVHHYRLFCDAGWQPIKPRGEVYTLDFTEKGWKSFSELHADPRDPLHDTKHGMGVPG